MRDEWFRLHEKTFGFSADIQFSFVYFICPEDEELSLVYCYSDLIEQGEFGYPVTTFSEEEIARENVFGFCCSLLPFLSKTSIDPLKGEFLKHWLKFEDVISGHCKY